MDKNHSNAWFLSTPKSQCPMKKKQVGVCCFIKSPQLFVAEKSPISLSLAPHPIGQVGQVLARLGRMLPPALCLGRSNFQGLGLRARRSFAPGCCGSCRLKRWRNPDFMVIEWGYSVGIYLLVMTNSLPWEIHPFLIGKPSISMGHGFHGYVK